ncbi:MAG: CoA transferase [Bacteroidales bacterium]
MKIDLRNNVNKILTELNINDDSSDITLNIYGEGPVIASKNPIAEATTIAHAIMGYSTAKIWKHRTGEPVTIDVDIHSSLNQLMEGVLTKVSGYPVAAMAEDPLLLGNSSFYKTKDDKWIFYVMIYPELRDIVCSVLDCPPIKEKIAKATLNFTAQELEDAICSKGGTAAIVRTREEWENHPQGKILRSTPLFTITKIGESPKEDFQLLENVTLPLAGINVLDNTHVIAGPVAARNLAESGANVLHISSPLHPDPNWMIAETNIGKKAAYCNLDNPEEVKAFYEIIEKSDIYINSYMNLEKKGFTPEKLAQKRPGLIILDFRAWGLHGEWSNRGGFDQLASSATGAAIREGSYDSPKLPPSYLLNDSIAAILGTAGVMETLKRRASEGGSYHVHVDLARITMWIQDLGCYTEEQIKGLPNPPKEISPSLLRTLSSSFGETIYLPTPIKYSAFTPELKTGATPLGMSKMSFDPE